jgi:hypothetical protein
VIGGSTSSDVTLRVHDNAVTFIDPPGGSACVFDPADTASEPASVGIEAEWTLDPGIAGLAPLVLREEVVAFGTGVLDSGVRLTLGVTNPPASTVAASIGLRWQLDHVNSTDDGPAIAPVACAPFGVGTDLLREHEFLASEIQDFYRARNNTGTPIYDNFTSSTVVGGFPDTRKPDRLVYGNWVRLSRSAWDYAASEGAPDPDFDSAVLYYYGYLPADGIAVAPGATVTRSLVVFSTATAQRCGPFVPATPTCLIGSLSPIRALRGVKDSTGGARFEWLPDGAAGLIEYHLNSVTAKTSLREPDVHLPLAALQCVPQPPAAPGCTDPDAIADGTALFYQAFSACGPDGTEEGPL